MLSLSLFSLFLSSLLCSVSYGFYGNNTTTTYSPYFYCDDGCPISSSYYNDGWCDCVTCEDEPYYNCTSCLGGCPNATASCGSYSGKCYTTVAGNNTFSCNDGCVIDLDYVYDDWCDCTECEDEGSWWNCTTCGGCPDDCNSAIDCTSSGGDYSNFTCNDGCVISYWEVNNLYCDCSECEDEDWFNCTTCDDGCPSSCGDSTQCWHYNYPNYTTTAWSSSNLTCYDGCVISYWELNNGYCDCSECEDEYWYNCTSCYDGCPSSCGDSTQCWHYNYNNYTTTAWWNGNGDNFTCDDGCNIPQSWVNDSWCDCTSCEDEYYFTCNSCATGCPSDCGGNNYCYSSSGDNMTTTSSGNDDDDDSHGHKTFATLTINFVSLLACAFVYLMV